MKKRLWLKVSILALIFFLAVIVSSALTNLGSEDKRIDLGDPVLPRVSFNVEGREVNMLSGYVDEMDITSMRDTITPVPVSGKLQLTLNNCQHCEEDSTHIQYEVYTLDGSSRLDKGSVALEEDAAVLDLGKIFAEPEKTEEGSTEETQDEMVLKLIYDYKMGRDTVPVSYYTRIISGEELAINECLTFAEDFHDKTFNKEKKEEIGALLELDGSADNESFEHVTIHSDADHVTWGNMAPQIIGNVQWNIEETNPVYTSIQAEYRVSSEGDSQEQEIFNIKEFFRVRFVHDEMYLLDYDRTMNQVFDGNQKVINKEGILLGIVPEEIEYKVSAKGNIIAFVQERDLWHYNVKDKELSLVFSFANREGHDERSFNDQHAVDIISLQDDGSTVFAVYGYMNRGKHEGEVGAAIYYYDMENNVVEEKAFIPSNKSAMIAKNELGKMTYYSENREILYVIADGKLLEVDLHKKEPKVLAEGLVNGQYVVSEDAQVLAYQMSGSYEPGTAVNVLDLETGEGHIINAPENEMIRALGFMGEDFIYGRQYPADESVTVTGDKILPMYQITIVDKSGTVVKEYVADGMYFSDIRIEKNLLTIYRGVITNGVYTQTDEDYISSSKKAEENGVAVEKFYTELQQTQIMLTLPEDHTKDTLKLLRPKQVAKDVYLPIAIEGTPDEEIYYVYGLGELAGIFTDAADAVQYADKVSGVVVNTDQTYVWEKGNRNLVYDSEIEKYSREEGESTLEACERTAMAYGSRRVNLTGCTLDELYYIINKGTPVIAMIDTDYAVLLTGYTMTDVVYVDPYYGEEYTVSEDEMKEMLEAGGNIFIGYIN